MTELNSSIKSFNNRLDHGEESLNSNTDHLKLARQRNRKKKKMKKAYMNYETQLNEQLFPSWESQKERKV